MNEKTLTALKGSIRKWEKIVDGTGVDLGVTNCDLCRLFVDDFCFGCPVNDVTRNFCNRSPYSAWEQHQENFHHRNFDLDFLSIVGKCRTCKKLAREELEFLKSLLPQK